MKRTASALALIFWFLIVAPAIQAVPAKETWISVRSTNFYLVGNASEKEIRQVAARFELMKQKKFSEAKEHPQHAVGGSESHSNQKGKSSLRSPPSLPGRFIDLSDF